jgi:hypothetical protein
MSSASSEQLVGWAQRLFEAWDPSTDAEDGDIAVVIAQMRVVAARQPESVSAARIAELELACDQYRHAAGLALDSAATAERHLDLALNEVAKARDTIRELRRKLAEHELVTAAANGARP